MDEGWSLYDPYDVRGLFYEWREIGRRPFEVHVAPVDALPDRPARVLDAIARDLAAWTGAAPEPGPWQRPLRDHSRPFRDLPFVWNGRTMLAARPHLATALAERPDYAAYARERRIEEARRELDDRSARLALDETPEGRAMLARVDSPGPRDLERHLAAWLGDVPAVDAFGAWEIEAVARVLDGRAEGEPGFADLYAAAYRLFFVPSYARILAPLVLGRDPASGLVGLWRIVLPREVWIDMRKKGYDEHIEYGRIPMDFLPERPLGHWLAERLASTRPDLARAIGAAGLVPAEIVYQSLVKPRRRNPPHAYDEVRVTLRFRGASAGELELIAELDHGVLRAVEVRSTADPTLAAAIEGEIRGQLP